MSPDPAAAERRKWLALMLLAVAQFVVVLDASITNVALPSIGRDLEISQENLAWVVNGYTLVFGGFLLLGGRIADLVGRRRMFIVGLILFSAASLVGGFSTSEGMLIGARAVQGLGAALVSPAALSILTVTFAEGPERNKAMGVWGAVAGSGGAAGVLLGGMLTEWLSWEWVLWVNVPIGIVAAILALSLIDESKQESDTRHFDIAGAISVTAGLSILVYALVDANDAGWGSGQTLGLLALSAALLAAFVVVEQRSKSPLVPFRIFGNRTLTGANVTGLLIGASLFSMFFYISLYMQQTLGYDALKAGVAYLPLALTIIMAAGLASALVTKIGFKPVLLGGLSLVVIALLWFSQVSVGGSYVGDILFPSVIAGAGLGFAFVPVTLAATHGTDEHDAGLASGLINTSQQVGGALGLAILSAVAAGVTGTVVPGAPGSVEALTDGFQAAFLTGAGLAALGVVSAALLIRGSDSKALIGAEVAPGTAVG
ncbi:MAG: MFS transporter [Solirubrobacteraceae bacterium]|nr:MFS transporter [Solirubrobacteraceae bacterium]